MRLWIERRMTGEPKPQAGIATAIFDVAGILLDADPGFLAATGYALDEIRGKPHRILVPESELDGEAYAAFWAGILSGEVVTARPLRLGKDGRRVRFQASYSPIRGHDGSPIGVLKSALDVTDADGAGIPVPPLRGPNPAPRPVWPEPVGGGPRRPPE